MWASTDQTTEQQPAVDATDEAATDLFHGFGSSPDAPRLLFFTAAGQTCACELSAVREIIPYCRATRLPGAPSYVTGLINLRGSIITVLDLGLRLGGAAVDVERGSIILAVRGNGLVGFAVDELRDVQRVNRDAIATPDPNATRDGLVCGVLRADSGVADSGVAESSVAVLVDLGQIVALTML